MEIPIKMDDLGVPPFQEIPSYFRQQKRPLRKPGKTFVDRPLRASGR